MLFSLWERLDIGRATDAPSFKLIVVHSIEPPADQIIDCPFDLLLAWAAFEVMLRGHEIV
jgi:hypothetical protein